MMPCVSSLPHTRPADVSSGQTPAVGNQTDCLFPVLPVWLSVSGQRGDTVSG